MYLQIGTGPQRSLPACAEMLPKNALNLVDPTSVNGQEPCTAPLVGTNRVAPFRPVAAQVASVMLCLRFKRAQQKQEEEVRTEFGRKEHCRAGHQISGPFFERSVLADKGSPLEPPIIRDLLHLA